MLEDVYGLIASPELIELTYSTGCNGRADAAHLAVALRMLGLALTMRFALHRSFGKTKEEGCHIDPFRKPALLPNPRWLPAIPLHAGAARSPPGAS